MKKMCCLAAILGWIWMASAAAAGFGGIWKPVDSELNFWISEHDTGSMTVVMTPDAITFDGYLDPDFSDGFSAADLGGKGHHLSILFAGPTEAAAVWTPSGGAPVNYTLRKQFGGSYAGMVVATTGLFADPVGLAYQVTGSSPFGITRFSLADGSPLEIYQDSAPRAFKGKVYILGQYGNDTVTVLDAFHPVSAPISQYSVGKTDPAGLLDIPTTESTTNPQDMAFLDESTAYMSFLGAPVILKLDPMTGERLGLIDISAFSEGDDGIPEASAMVRVESYLYVALQRLDRNAGFEPADAMILKIDTATDQVVDLNPGMEGVQGIPLARRNPGALVYLESTGELFVQCVGSYADPEIRGGVEVIDTHTDLSKGLILTEEGVGSPITDVAVCHAGKGYFLGYDPVGDWPWTYFISEFNPSTGALVDPKFFQAPYFIQDMVSASYQGACALFVGDRSDADPAVLVFDTGTNSLAAKAETLLPPQYLAVLER